MGYRIVYDDLGGKYEISSASRGKNPMLLWAFLGLLLLGSAVFWPEGSAKLRSWFIPGEDAVTVQAFQIMRDDLLRGASLGDAVEAFCRYVIHGA